MHAWRQGACMKSAQRLRCDMRACILRAGLQHGRTRMLALAVYDIFHNHIAYPAHPGQAHGPLALIKLSSMSGQHGSMC